MRRLLQATVLTLVAATVLAGCASKSTTTDPDGVLGNLVPVEVRYKQPYNVTAYYSHTLAAGPYKILEAQSVYVDVELPLDSLGAAVINGVPGLNAPRVHLGLFMPDVPAGTKVPVIADVGPYYGDSDEAATSNQTHRLGGFLIENFVPHGYAVAQVSVFGSGLSNHCMDLMGLDEQRGIDAAVTWLGTQPWSNGKVGLIGRSYDGSTPWEAAAMGNKYMATMVPISGLVGQHELMWRNGSVEARGPIMHNVVYGTFGIDSASPPVLGNGDVGQPDVEDLQTLCSSYVQGPFQGAQAYVTGGDLDPEVNQYWQERYFLDRALGAWNGSVYFIHGLQDWNVKPHMAFPTYNLIREHWETKGLFGQWNHMYPDRPSEHITTPSGEGHEAFPLSVRYDWAQDLLEWFDHYLKGTGPKPALHTEVQDNRGQWRIEQDYPAADSVKQSFDLAGDFTQTSTGPAIIMPASNANPGLILNVATLPAFPVEYAQADALAAPTHIAGLATLHLDVTPIGAGGQIYAEIRDLDDGNLRLGHAIMDLRYAAGGTELVPVIAGQSITARMQFEIIDAVVPAGHHLGLWLSSTGREYLASTTPAAVQINGGTLTLPTIGADHGLKFGPPAWSGDAEAQEQQP